MKIIVLGATGLTGLLVVDQAIERGFEVVAYVRNASSLKKRKGLAIVEGHLADSRLLEETLVGANAVLCCIGTRSKRFAKEVSLMQESLSAITSAMQRARVDRLILLSAFGVGESARQAGWLARIIYRVAFAAIYRDKALAEAALERTALNWTVLYPVGLTNGPLSDEVDVRPLSQVRSIPGIPMVSRANTARAMLDAIVNKTLVDHRLVVTARGTVK